MCVGGGEGASYLDGARIIIIRSTDNKIKVFAKHIFRGTKFIVSPLPHPVLTVTCDLVTYMASKACSLIKGFPHPCIESCMEPIAFRFIDKVFT